VAEFVVITGMSGAGRSQAANRFEDLGWYVVDNLPPALVPKVQGFADAPDSSISRVGLVLGLNLYLDEVAPALVELKESAEGSVRILFLDASTPELVKRFESTKRRHPFASIPPMGVSDAIEAEREALGYLRSEADVVVDISEYSIYQLNRFIRRTTLALGRVGSIASNGSGDIFIAFSTANEEAAHNEGGVAPLENLANNNINPLFEGVVQATEEAIVNAVVAGRDMVGANGRRIYGLPHDRLRDILRRYSRLNEPQ